MAGSTRRAATRQRSRAGPVTVVAAGSSPAKRHATPPGPVSSNATGPCSSWPDRPNAYGRVRQARRAIASSRSVSDGRAAERVGHVAGVDPALGQPGRGQGAQRQLPRDPVHPGVRVARGQHLAQARRAGSASARPPRRRAGRARWPPSGRRRRRRRPHPSCPRPRRRGSRPAGPRRWPAPSRRSARGAAPRRLTDQPSQRDGAAQPASSSPSSSSASSACCAAEQRHPVVHAPGHARRVCAQRPQVR